jgi:hypothetical protein
VTSPSRAHLGGPGLPEFAGRYYINRAGRQNALQTWVRTSLDKAGLRLLCTLSRLVRQRRSARGRCTLAGAYIGCAAAFIFCRRELLQLGVAAFDALSMKLFEEGNTPAATGARAPALRKLAWDPRPIQANEVDQLSPADVKAVANLGIFFH